jgi:hypothetical protein
LVQILSPFGFWTSWGVVRALFLNFSKICIFAPVTDFRRFSFFSNRRNLTFFFQKFAQSAVPFFFGWPWVLDMAEGYVPRCLEGVCFWILRKSSLAKKRHGV